jgi:hypothetical protein
VVTRFVAIAVALGVATVTSATGKAANNFTPEERRVIASHLYWNVQCRGGTARIASGACEVREAIGTVLDNLRICNGLRGQVATEMVYHRCRPGSYRLGNQAPRE